MCVFSGEAEVTGQTTVAASVAKCPDSGKLLHVLLYHNSVKNLAPGANALCIAFPSKVPMGQQNVLDMSNAPNLVQDIKDALNPFKGRGALSFGSWSASVPDGVEIFEHDVYTVVMADDARKIPAALQFVREDRHPEVNQEVYDRLAEIYPGCPVALCCFNNRDAKTAKPLVWKYEPIHPDILMVPTLDAHDGSPPAVGAPVEVNHQVIFGGTKDVLPFLKHDRRFIKPVTYSDELTPLQRALLPTHVMGMKYNGLYMPNGDFWIDVRGGMLPRDIKRGLVPV